MTTGTGDGGGLGDVAVLVVVMGTSGSGKSTVGAALGRALDCPFVDGDDLHPAANVAKMSSGQPLDDTDREPWLQTIRSTGKQLALTQHQPHLPSVVKPLAEVYETSHQHLTPKDTAVQSTPQPPTSSQSTQGGVKVAVIACSSLKLVYRRLLRGSIDSLNDAKAKEPESGLDQQFKVIHVYLDLDDELLELRMHNRKGHFMKLDMLRSQLATLQKPNPATEPGIISIPIFPDTTTDSIVTQTIAQLKSQSII